MSRDVHMAIFCVCIVLYLNFTENYALQLELSRVNKLMTL